MSWKGFAPMGNETRRRYGRNKMCCCGGHNSSNVKRNKNHSSTKKRLMIRMDRRIRLLEKVNSSLIE